MQQVIRQLEWVRRAGRWLLLLQRLMQWAGTLLVVMGLCAGADYLLRLPGWLRLIVGVAIAVAAMSWLVRRLQRAAAFWPDLSLLALRAERIDGRLAGMLTSSIEFAANRSDYASPPRTGQLADITIGRLQQQLAHRPLVGLIKKAPTWRVGLAFGAVLLITIAVVAAAPAQSLLAGQRWFNPLGAAAWPRRTAIRSLVRAALWPVNTPLPLEAVIERGYRPAMRAWVVYRMVNYEGHAGEYQRQLLTDQSPGDDRHPHIFTRVLDPNLHSGPAPGASAISFYFESGDDRTQLQTVQLVVRPAVQQVNVQIQPPTYARGLVPPQQVQLDALTGESSLFTAGRGLVGSRVTFRFTLNQTNVQLGDFAAVLPGFTGQRDAAFAFDKQVIEARFALMQTAQTTVQLTDTYGFSNMSQRQYRIEAITDKPPVVTIVEPGADEAVLTTAVIDVQAAGRDDVGVEQLKLNAQITGKDQTDITQTAGRGSEMQLHHRLALGAFALRPGDTLVLTAVALDGFELDGTRHEPVRSSPRTLTIIDSATLIRQMRSQLATVRQQAIRLQTRQRQVMKMSADSGEPAQRALGRRLATQQTLGHALAKRLERNRLEVEQARPLQQLLEQTGQLLDQAQQASRRAAGQLHDALAETDRARQNQQQVTEALARLARLLDHGSDAIMLQLLLQQLLTQQSNLADDTQQMLPHTLGQTADQLSLALKRRLNDLAQRQRALAQKADRLTQKMQATSQILQQQGEAVKDQAAAAALAQAVAIAGHQGLKPAMEQAGRQTRQNRLSAAGYQQQQAMSVMQEMLNDLRDQPRRRQEMLRRRLFELADAIRHLVDQQSLQIKQMEAIAAGGQLWPLAQSLARLRHNTLSVAQQAAGLRSTQIVGQMLEQAGVHQVQALTAISKALAPDAATAEDQALAKLRQALELVDNMQSEMQQQTDAQRHKLRQAYLQLAKRQAALRDRTAPFTQLDKLDRRRRMEVVELGQVQADLRNEVGALRDQVEKTLLFIYTHDRIGRLARRAADRLRRGQADRDTTDDQTMIAFMLEAMAAALDEVTPDESFADNQNEGGGGGGGGGAGGGGKAKPLIPPIAQLKLLRAMQHGIYQQTREIQEAGDDRGDDKVLELSAQQRELAGLGQSLIEALRPASAPTEQP